MDSDNVCSDQPIRDENYPYNGKRKLSQENPVGAVFLVSELKFEIVGIITWNSYTTSSYLQFQLRVIQVILWPAQLGG